MAGEISYDLVMQDDMDFVEGSYRVNSGNWQVFIVSKAPIDRAEIRSSQWSSRVTGVVIRFPLSVRLNKQAVEQLMSQELGVSEWHEVRGPDSIQLR
jgi:hypothetical protein